MKILIKDSLPTPSPVVTFETFIVKCCRETDFSSILNPALNSSVSTSLKLKSISLTKPALWGKRSPEEIAFAWTKP